MSSLLGPFSFHTQLKNYQVTLVIPAVKEGDISHFVISDSANDPSGKSKPQHGWIQGTTGPNLNAGRQAVMGIMAWRSRKLRRKAGNTLLCESIALSTALGSLERQVAMRNSLVASNFPPKDMMQDDYNEHKRAAMIASQNVEGAHMEPMLSLLASNKYQIQEEQEVLDAGKQSQCRLKS
ncbi:unnamed protein product [Symbiodinium sp. CCMP2592]|nr:unnamed protein product [Symbiodinium sp. CCMP2592]